MRGGGKTNKPPHQTPNHVQTTQNIPAWVKHGCNLKLQWQQLGFKSRALQETAYEIQGDGLKLGFERQLRAGYFWPSTCDNHSACCSVTILLLHSGTKSLLALTKTSILKQKTNTHGTTESIKSSSLLHFKKTIWKLNSKKDPSITHADSLQCN